MTSVWMVSSNGGPGTDEFAEDAPSAYAEEVYEDQGHDQQRPQAEPQQQPHPVVQPVPGPMMSPPQQPMTQPGLSQQAHFEALEAQRQSMLHMLQQHCWQQQ
eukprot:5019232-Prorocentrum_lima.AAC.1